jgi:hypothetical protein
VKHEVKEKNDMKREIGNPLRILTAGLAIAAGICLSNVGAFAQGENNTHLGTWMVTVTPPAASGRPAFNALLTFGRGGAFIATTQNDHLVPNSGVQQGTWRRSGSGQIGSTELYFVYDPTGVAVGTVKVRATYDFRDGDDMVGQGQLSRCDLNGANCIDLPGCATISGKRVEVEDPMCP